MIKFPKVVLVVVDGLGIASPSAGNAFTLANPPFIKQLIANYPIKVLQASGPSVGLPWKENGNSEVGHLCMGSGRIVVQELSRINQAITDGSFAQNKAILDMLEILKKTKGRLHLAGLIGDGNVHASEQHLYTLIGLAKEQGINEVLIHAFTDGRDTPAKVAGKFIEKINKFKKGFPGLKIASLTGRFYAMDRGGHWTQTDKTVDTIIEGQGEKYETALEALEDRYKQGIDDEMIPPTVIGQSPVFDIKKDVLFLYNFRSDRMIQLVQAIVKKSPEINVFTMTSYEPKFKVKVVFPPLKIDETLGEVISKKDWKQFRLAESEKFAHVTFFFNGHQHPPFTGEERKIVKSPAANTKNYENVPEMSAEEITEIAVQRIKNNDDRFVLINFANADMVGHTGNIEATKKAILTVDNCLKNIAKAVDEVKAVLLITADHGNCEDMLSDVSGNPKKDHSNNPIPLIFYSDVFKFENPKQINFYTLAGIMPQGILSDIAPTVLKLLGVSKPTNMTGDVLEI